MKKALSILSTFVVVVNLFAAFSNISGEIVASFQQGNAYGGELSTNMRVGNRFLSEFDTYGEYYLQILGTTAYWNAKPSSIHFDCQLNGNGFNSVSDLYVDCLSRSGSVISTTLLTQSSSNGHYSADITPHKNVYGFRLHHTKSSQIIISIESATLSATGIAHKRIENGMVVIIKDGIRYDTRGRTL